MRAILTAALVAGLVTCLPGGASARSADAISLSQPAPRVRDASARAPLGRDADTLWIFDADFEDHQGDNANWQTFDMSGYPVVDGDFWHKDTIRLTESYLGDSTWWCGTYCSWWRQPRGYGNDWAQWLYRLLPLNDWSDPGDAVTFEWDQRYALEHDYDYGFVDVSNDYAATWLTVAAVVNNGFAGKPGPSVDWDSTNGHRVVDLSDYAGQNIYVRFRMESDCSYSSQDEYDNPPTHSALDGAWQIDNLNLEINGSTVWSDDCEAPGENGWVHHSAPRVETAGVTFQRLFEPDTFRGFTCGAGTGWMMAAVDTATGLFVEDQRAALVSPPVDVAGLADIVVRWSAWLDVPWDSGEEVNFTWVESDIGDVPTHAAVPRAGWNFPECGPAWALLEQDVMPGRDWIAMVLYGSHYSSSGSGPYTAGLLVDRCRIGTRVGEEEMTFWYPASDGFWDSFDYISNWVYVLVSDPGGVTSMRTVASADGGQTWASANGWDDGGWWNSSIPSSVWLPNTEILYYFEATDEAGNTAVCPSSAPDLTFTVRRLPIVGTEEEPAVLIVDKRASLEPGFTGTFDPRPWWDVETALDILGHAHDVLRADGPTNAIAYTYYDTHIWLTGDLELNTLTDTDQSNLVNWLAGSAIESPRRLILIGNDIGHDLVEEGADAVGLFPTWLQAEYVERHPGEYFVSEPDTNIVVRDAGLGLMTHDDGECWLRCGCPDMGLFDVIDALPGGDSHVILEYENGLGEIRPAGVVRVDSLTGAAIALIPFDLARMTEGAANGHTDALADRVSLLGNLLEYMGRTPSGSGTGVDGSPVFATALLAPHPNPFNPTTTVAYTLATPEHVTIRVCDVAGRVVCTLVDEERTAGEHATVWDGRTDTGDGAASGVYFVRMTTSPGNGVAPQGGSSAETRQQKLVLLK